MNVRKIIRLKRLAAVSIALLLAAPLMACYAVTTIYVGHRSNAMTVVNYTCAGNAVASIGIDDDTRQVFLSLQRQHHPQEKYRKNIFFHSRILFIGCKITHFCRNKRTISVFFLVNTLFIIIFADVYEPKTS